MKKRFGGVILVFLFTLLVLRYGMMKNWMVETSLYNPFSCNSSDHLQWLNVREPPAVQNLEDGSQVVPAETLFSNLLMPRNLSDRELQALQIWNHLQHIISQAEGLPHAVEAIKEAGTAWESLMVSVEGLRPIGSGNASELQKVKQKQCLYSISRMNASEFGDGAFSLKIPCGLVQGSSITFIGTPGGLLGDFRIDLTGTALPREQDRPIILHYNVRLHGDRITEDPVIVQNTWTVAYDWGAEERCPSPNHDDNKKVDDLEKCSATVGRDVKRIFSSRYSNSLRQSYTAKQGAKPRRYFPFKQGYIAIATLRVGVEGIQMTVDGKHITSFAFRERLEPWFVSEARISGDFKLISVLASGLPTSEDSEHVADLEMLKSPPMPIHKAVDLFIGIISTANNFERRMAIRRTWMQYEAVKSGTVAVQFFVGLNKNQMANEELWNEAHTYGDIQLMPFVDYYTLITWKTIAIGIYGTQVVRAKYVMKTDDDAFVRIDEVLSSLNRLNVTHGLLYGRINFASQPQRGLDSKWYISREEWPEDKYPPWAHGPGYVVSGDIAKAVYEEHKKGRLKMFKLEDVAMGIWIDELKKRGLDVKYVKEERVYNLGCKAGYVVAHYQGPQQMLCLWENLLMTHMAMCC